MRVDASIAALRRDRPSQRRLQILAQETRADWLAKPEVAPVASALAQYAQGAALDELPALARIVSDLESGRDFVSCWVEAGIAALGREPLCQIAHRHSCSPGLSTMRLLSAGGASLTVLAYEQRPEMAHPATASFVDREQRELVLAGKGFVLFHERVGQSSTDERVRSRELHLLAGRTVSLAPLCESRQVLWVEGRMLVLQLARSSHNPRPTCEYRLSDGALVRQASGDKRASQLEMAMAVLGAMHRRDAVPAIARHASHGAPHLRWDALRHIVALDPVRGVSLLGDIASVEHDPLTAPARNLRQDLLARFPQLEAEGNAQCRS
jgi:hypothetical protein